MKRASSESVSAHEIISKTSPREIVRKNGIFGEGQVAIPRIRVARKIS
jgi:hypothetical protein